MTNSKAKGSRNERNVVKLLNDWSGYEFARTPQSGGLHWKKQYTSGDIVCIDDKHGRRFPFSIECKSHQNFDLLHLIDDSYGKSSNKIMMFWEQSKGDALKYNKVPLVFMRRNGMKANLHFVVMNKDFFNLWYSNIGEGTNKRGIIMYNSYDKDSLVIINSDDLITTNYKDFYKSGRNFLKNK